MSTIVTFGEIMGRFSPPGLLRLRQCLPGSLDISFAGAEANVAASLAVLGRPTRFVTALPDNPLADACVDTLRGLGIDTAAILRKDSGRLGLYFVESGANQRPSQVVYDRSGSTISLTAAGRIRLASDAVRCELATRQRDHAGDLACGRRKHAGRRPNRSPNGPDGFVRSEFSSEAVAVGVRRGSARPGRADDADDSCRTATS